MALTGIYKIQSKIKPERIYIGSAINIDYRWYDHIRYLRELRHGNAKLQNHFSKYGITDLQFSVILECNRESLIVMEQQFLDDCNPYFNICKTANSRLGVKQSKETKKKISNRLKGRSLSEEHKESLKKAYHDNPDRSFFSDKTRQKIREANLRNRNIPPSREGVKLSEETKQKMVNARRRKKLEKMMQLLNSKL